jgi:N-acetylmuramoyl-L-alanine amidase
MIKRFLILVFFVPSLLILFSFIPAIKQKSLRTIIVDAGHGGRDFGAKGTYSYEKDICLAISLQLGEMLKKEIPDAKILFTRTTDTYPELHARANFANQNKGDLYVCIHVNAAPAEKHSRLVGHKTEVSYVGKGKKKKKVVKKIPQYNYWTTPNPAKGTETYIWGAQKNEDKEIAMRENAPMLTEENFKEKYGDIDPDSPEFIALSLLKTKQYFKRSATLAGYIQDEFSKIGRIDRDVRQRSVGIWVLQATAMPSILVETGYITNKSEEDYLNSPNGQTEIAGCVTGAIKKYVEMLEKQQSKPANNNGRNKMPSSNDNIKDAIKPTTNIEKKAFR